MRPHPGPQVAIRGLASILAVSVLLLCSYPLFFHGLADRDLTSSHEARAAQNAQMMLATGDWHLPRLFDKQVDLQKPPLYYWLVACLARLNGGQVNALAVRLPAALGALGTICLLLGFGHRLRRPLVGWLAALLLATFWHFTWMARVGRIDMPLTFTVTTALVAFWLAWQEPERCRRWLMLAYGAIGVGVLLKGPIAAVLPALPVFGWLVWQRWFGSPVKHLGRLPHSLWWGVPLALAIAAPWFIWANFATDGQLFRVFFLYHNVERGLGSDGTLASHPWWFYGPRAAIDLLPWSLVLPLALWTWWRNLKSRRDPLMSFGLVWLVAMVLFLSLMRFKRADYLLPAYPGAAIFLGCAVERWLQQWGRRVAWGLGAVAMGCLVAWGMLAQSKLTGDDASRPYRSFAAEIRRHTDSHVLFFRVECHPLAFHVGRPMHTLLEWENLDAWAAKKQPVYLVLDAATLAEWPNHLHQGRLELVARAADFLPPGELPRQRDDLLVLARTRAWGSTAP